jgi:glycosyltransferase involved in cell wall biosynthesis
MSQPNHSFPIGTHSTPPQFEGDTTTLDITIAICTYNGADRIGQVLEKLRSQTNVENIKWEIIVVDNNSTDNLQAVISHDQTHRFPADRLRYVFEPQQGAAFARIKAVQVARGHLVAFLDDDTLPAPDWLANVSAFAQTHPTAGAYGGQIHAEFEVKPTPEFKPLAIYLAIVERGPKPYIYSVKKRVLPPSAGLVVQRQAWLNSVPNHPFLTGRTPYSMLTSEDIAAIAHIQNAGWDIWYAPDLHIYHQIPRWRLERSYLIALIQGIGLAKHHIRMIRLPPWQRPVAFLAYFTNDLAKLLRYWLQHRQTLTTDLVTACEMQLLRSTVISPFYLWRMALQRK